ncbi:ABC transporter permease [Nesterenkonia halotolerans]|uniref:Autoinducer 2 import system permease protein LsrC n=1 Tax=Nesterenkonia halotolerans TaxID=225325 RepID=A0ABR9J7U5_9MICC|nr:ABC transporter permease [Nesterenkonia halotolerans]MBE1515060.1 rhamnose transport system permease protein [Nesterenkonia halotolerans]
MTAETLTPAKRENSSMRAVRSLLASRETAIVLVILVIIAVATSFNQSFLFTGQGWRDLLLTPSILMVVAVGSAVVIITRNVDLSVGSTLAITAYMTGRLFVDVPGIPIFVVVLLGILVGAGLGLINGALVAFGKVPALVVTLGTMYIYRGAVLTWAGSDRINASDMPGSFLNLGTMQILSIPLLTIVAVLVLIVAGYWLSSTRSGREMYAIGSDPEAAKLYGLPTTKRVIIAFILGGALAGLAGVMYAARYGTVSSSAGMGWEFDAIGAAVIGGVAIFGGSGTVWGAAFGAILLMTINRTLPIVGIPDFWQRAVVGALIIGAIVLDRYLSVRRHRKLQEARDKA